MKNFFYIYEEYPYKIKSNVLLVLKVWFGNKDKNLRNSYIYRELTIGAAHKQTSGY